MVSDSINIRKLEESDYPAVKDIYQSGIDTGDATLETRVPEWSTFNDKFLPAFRIVAVENEKITGWAALSAVSNRYVYSGVSEVTVYVHPDFSGRGIGTLLLSALIEKSEENGIWTLEARIFPENEASVHLHKKLGFRKVGIREKLGQHNGHWRDILLMERRSKII